MREKRTRIDHNLPREHVQANQSAAINEHELQYKQQNWENITKNVESSLKAPSSKIYTGM